MAGKWYYSKTRWKTQRRDLRGRWTSGGSKASAAATKAWKSNTRGAKATRRIATNAAVFANQHVQAGVNPYKTSGHVTITGGKTLRALPTHKLNISLTVSIDPKGQSVFEKQAGYLGNRAAAAVGNKLKSRAAHDAVQIGLGNARAIKVLGTTLSASGNRKRSGTVLRTSTPKQRLRQARRDQRAHVRKERDLKRNLSADQKNGVPSTVTGAKGMSKGRAQRRNKQGNPATPKRNSIHNELRNERAAGRLKGGVSPSRVVGGTKKKKKSGGTYTK